MIFPDESSSREFSPYPMGQMASYALTDGECELRKYSETAHSYRSVFQRDRDRVVHCSAFRRLDFKTQVFVPHEHDHYRTRLTHSLEVAQIGRTLGRAIGLNEDLIEAVALAHDLGHAPFGHGGEEVLDELMADQGRFEHNRQSLRVVDYLEHPYPDFRGLNLTFGVRECIAKHESRFDHPISDDFDMSRRSPLEGQLVDLADEIAYTSADIDDSLAAGIIDENQLGQLELWKYAIALADKHSPDARAIHKRIRACKILLASMADDVLANTARNIEQMSIKSPDDVRLAPEKVVSFSPRMTPLVRQVQLFLYANVYTAGDNAEKNDRSQKIIRDIFGAYLDNISLLPDRYKSRIDSDGLYRTICDYIAGMTDRFCTAEHGRILEFR